MDNIKECPFCGSSIVEFKENKYWTGMRFNTASFDLFHWCGDIKTLNEPVIKIRGLTVEDAIEKWNKRK